MNWDITWIIVAVVVLAVLFLALREFVLWYFKIDERTALLREIRDHLVNPQRLPDENPTSEEMSSWAKIKLLVTPDRD